MQTILQGWAVPCASEGPLTHADHTYVVSLNNKKWGCWGRDEGGHMICQGKGDATKANCLSQPLGKALVVYAVTGVCHQTANRILRPTRQTVSKAQAYAVSWALYGAYGGCTRAVDPAWKAHEAICGIWDWRPDPLYLARDEQPDAHFAALHSAHSNMATAVRERKATVPEAIDEVRRLELEAVVRARIHGGLSDDKLRSLASTRSDMLNELEPMLLGLSGPRAIPDSAERANTLANAFLASASQTLDKTEFKALFDVEIGTQVVVAEPGIAASWVQGS